jgi:hypothetical protein
MSYSAADYPQEIEIVAGKARDLDVSIALTSGSLALADITDAWFTIKASEADADADAKIMKRMGSGITLLSVASGVIAALVQLTNADTAALTAGRVYAMDFQIDTTARGPEQVAWGSVTVRAPITIANS